MDTQPPENIIYAKCFCFQCNGSYRTRLTVQRHRTRRQKPLTREQRICYCSKHSLGRQVCRTTARIHKNLDLHNGITNVRITSEHLAEIIAEAGIDEPVISEDTIPLLQRLRDAGALTQSEYTVEDEDQEKSGDEEDDNIGSEIGDADIRDEEEEMDNLEAQQSVDAEPLPPGRSLYSWVCLN